MKKILTIAKHEFKLTAGTKAYKIITIIGPFLIIAVTVLPALLANRAAISPKETVIGITGGGPGFYEALRPALERAKIIPVSCGAVDECRDLIRGEAIHGYMVLGDNTTSEQSITYYSRTGTDIGVSETLKAVVGRVIVSLRLAEAGLDPGRIAELTKTPNLTVKKITRDGAEEEGRDFLSVMLSGLAFIMLLYMTVLLYGQMIGRSVVNEKTTKTVEIMLASVRPSELMYGKIFGLGFAGLLQYAIWVGVGAVLIKIVGPLFSLSLPASFSGGNLAFLVLFFVLAFFLYSSAFAALGAASEDEQHFGQLIWPLIVCLALPLVLISPMVMNPESLFVRIMSFFPMTAPMIMFTRTLVSMPPVWEILLCVALLMGTIGLFIAGAGKIFRIGILMTGKRFNFKEIIKWLHV